MQYSIVKHSHIMFVALTLLLFNLRFWLRTAKPEQGLPNVLKIIPHLNDTLLLCSGLWLIHITRFTPFGNADWLGVKLLLLLVYISFGLTAMRATPKTCQAWLSYALSMLCVVAIIYLARYKPF